MTAAVEYSGAWPGTNNGWPSHPRRPDTGDKGR
jgi:hypothetical protein